MRTYLAHPNHPDILCYFIETHKIARGLYKNSIYTVKDHYYDSHPWVEIEWDNGEHEYFYGWYWKPYYHVKAILKTKKKMKN